jgi:2-oxoisovalerate dehydrogenase E1 component
MTETNVSEKKQPFLVNKAFDKETVLHDYYIANLSRQLSILGRKEALSGKAKFGIFGDGKELGQIAFAKAFRNGDWRSGYYRDQTFMMYLGILNPVEFFAQMYGDTNMANNPQSGGRNFNNHFSTPVYKDGQWLNVMELNNSSADTSPTSGQMPRLLGLAYASKLLRKNKKLHKYKQFSNKGNEVAFGTIGDASTSEGPFFETINAAGVLQVPLAIAIWDDGYGISVPTELQTTKGSISQALKGFEADAQKNGILIYHAAGWNYPELCRVFSEGINRCRTDHIPVLFHITEVTQPQGHSTSGSHERYKSKDRLQWEQDFDPIKKMQDWILQTHIASAKELEEIEIRTTEEALQARDTAWKNYTEPLIALKNDFISIVRQKTCTCKNNNQEKINALVEELAEISFPIRKDILSTAKKLIRNVCFNCPADNHLRSRLTSWIREQNMDGAEQYSSFLYNETSRSALNVEIVAPVYSESSPVVHGRVIIRDNFDKLFEKYPLLVAFGEDVGKIGSVNQTYEGLQKKYGDLRISDTGIRETTIVGQGLGLALRGMRPIAEIQYFDYLLYALPVLSDDLATTHWRTRGQQIAPLIISTRGHRLEGIWHSGSPMAMVISAIRGIYVCVPRNMTQAAGFYNTLLKADDPGIVIEPLNGYRLKEIMPDNIGEYTVPLGIPEIMKEGTDITLVSYGSCIKIAMEATEQLAEFGISVELIDVQTLLPFDIHEIISKSVKKTNRVVFFDEDVPGGATAYMMHKVIEEQKAYQYLDSAPRTITAQDHRPAYTTDGDYFSNPNAEDVFETIYAVMHESDPKRWPKLY